MITKQALEHLRVSRPKPSTDLHYTIGGSIETQVHAEVESQRIRQLNHGDRRLNEALQEMRQDYAFSTNEGLAKAQFNDKGQDKNIAPQP